MCLYSVHQTTESSFPVFLMAPVFSSASNSKHGLTPKTAGCVFFFFWRPSASKSCSELPLQLPGKLLKNEHSGISWLTGLKMHRRVLKRKTSDVSGQMPITGHVECGEAGGTCLWGVPGVCNLLIEAVDPDVPPAHGPRQGVWAGPYLRDRFHLMSCRAKKNKYLRGIDCFCGNKIGKFMALALVFPQFSTYHAPALVQIVLY